jgi:hypothetical protein
LPLQAHIGNVDNQLRNPHNQTHSLQQIYMRLILQSKMPYTLEHHHIFWLEKAKSG